MFLDILVAVDGSPDAGEAPSQAIDLAAREHSGLTGLVGPPAMAYFGSTAVVFSIMLFDASPDLFTRWGQVIEQAPRELTSFLGIFRRAGLRQLKARYDPDNVFNQNFPIPPATDISRQETPTIDDRQ